MASATALMADMAVVVNATEILLCLITAPIAAARAGGQLLTWGSPGRAAARDVTPGPGGGTIVVGMRVNSSSATSFGVSTGLCGERLLVS